MSPKDKIGGKWVFPVPLLPMTCKFAFKNLKSPNKLFGDEYALCPQKTKSGEITLHVFFLKWVFPYSQWHVILHSKLQSPNKLFGDEYALCPQKTKSGENEYSRSPYSQWHVNLHSKLQSPPINYLGTNMLFWLTASFVCVSYKFSLIHAAEALVEYVRGSPVHPPPELIHTNFFGCLLRS